ncbi:hypothetical protein [Bacillus cereus]|uniref:hypothetical protein n=1 Tax=Bacillus cereus TaxID=1396 RepID=UPI001145661E|nr:hypothetical protein [Bacillus cereus]
MGHRITSKPEEDNSKSTHDKTHDSHSSYYAVGFLKFIHINANVCSINTKIALPTRMAEPLHSKYAFGQLPYLSS